MDQTFEYDAVLARDERIPDGYMKHFVAVPDEAGRAFREAGIGRVAGWLGPHAFRRALHTREDGSTSLRFGEGWLRDAGLCVGDELAVVLMADPDPNQVDIPYELSRALAEEPEVQEAWEALTPGKRRTLAHPVAQAKRAETRERRAAKTIEAVRILMDGGTWPPKRRRKR